MSKPKPMSSMSEKQANRFWALVTKCAPDECWLWAGFILKGYGRYTIRKKIYPAHRIAYFLHHGVDPGPLLVCHDCPGGDNPRCCNPAHLFLGTEGDNTRDAAKKGMMPIGDRNGSRLHPERMPRGERHGNAKFTAQDIREIRLERLAGKTYREIAKPRGCSLDAIQAIVLRRNWSHIA